MTAPPTRRRGPVRLDEAPLEISHSHSDDRNDRSGPHRQLPTADALVFRPYGRGRGWLAVVRLCPHACGGVHVHRVGPSGGIRRSGCGGEYHVRPTSRGWQV